MDISNKQTNFFKDEISLKDLYIEIKGRLKFLSSFKNFIIISTIFGLIFGFVYFKLQKVKYKAEISFVMEEGQNSISNGGGLASQLGLNIGGSKSNIFTGETFFAFMKTRFLVEKVLLSSIKVNGELITFAEYYMRTFGMRKTLEKDVELRKFIFRPNDNRENYSIKQVQLLNSIYSKIVTEYLDVKPKDKKTSFLSIIFISENEKFSKDFCDRIAEVASSFYIETINKKARVNVEILQKQTDSIRNELNLSLKSAAIASDKIFNLNPSALINKIASTKKQIEVQANTAILSQLVTNLESAKVSLRKETPLIQIIDAPIYPLEQVYENKLKYILISGICCFLFSVLISFFFYKNRIFVN